MARKDTQKIQNIKSSKTLGGGLSFGVGLSIVILVIFTFYVFFVFFNYLRSKPIVAFQVNVGSISESNIYDGLVLRNEEIVKAESAGNVNYYQREGEWVAVGDLIYSVDGSGKLSEYLSGANAGDVELSEQDLNIVKSDISQFLKDYDNSFFDSVYNFKYDLQGTTLRISNLNILDNIGTLQSGISSSAVNVNYAPKSGYIVYSTDGYEDIKESDINESLFDKDNYEKIQFTNNSLVSPGDDIYKRISSEEWSIIIEVKDNAKLAEFAEGGTWDIRLLKSNETLKGKAEIINNGEGDFVKFTFKSSMVNYITDRFLELEVVKENETGLKIPNSAIIERELFVVPVEYCYNISDTSGTCDVYVEKYDEEGNQTVKIVNVNICSLDETEVLIEDPSLEIGNYLIMENSDAKAVISKTQTMIGVYNINKGYAEFKPITILAQNEEYAIVRSNTTYGLRPYDRIASDASNVKENDLIYE